MADAGESKKRTFRKYQFRGVDLEQLLDLSTDELVELFCARQRRRWVLGAGCCLLGAGLPAGCELLLLRRRRWLCLEPACRLRRCCSRARGAALQAKGRQRRQRAGDAPCWQHVAAEERARERGGLLRQVARPELGSAAQLGSRSLRRRGGSCSTRPAAAAGCSRSQLVRWHHASSSAAGSAAQPPSRRSAARAWRSVATLAHAAACCSPPAADLGCRPPLPPLPQVPARPEAQGAGPDQEAAQGQEGGARGREARGGESLAAALSTRHCAANAADAAGGLAAVPKRAPQPLPPPAGRCLLLAAACCSERRRPPDLLQTAACCPARPQVRTHLRNMVIIPEMIGSVVGVYNGKTFNQVRGARAAHALRAPAGRAGREAGAAARPRARARRRLEAARRARPPACALGCAAGSLTAPLLSLGIAAAGGDQARHDRPLPGGVLHLVSGSACARLP